MVIKKKINCACGSFLRSGAHLAGLLLGQVQLEWPGNELGDRKAQRRDAHSARRRRQTGHYAHCSRKQLWEDRQRVGAVKLPREGENQKIKELRWRPALKSELSLEMPIVQNALSMCTEPRSNGAGLPPRPR